MRYSTRRLERLFIVRLWREAGASPDELRGTAQDVEGGARAVFSDLRELDEFLAGVLRDERVDGR